MDWSFEWITLGLYRLALFDAAVASVRLAIRAVHDVANLDK